MLVRTAIDLGHNLGLTVVAEGVENAGHVSALRALDCDIAQGYHYARPMPAADLTALLERAVQPALAPRQAATASGSVVGTDAAAGNPLLEVVGRDSAGSPRSSQAPSSHRRRRPCLASSAAAVAIVGRRAPTSWPEQAVREVQRYEHPVARHTPPALGKLPQHRQQATIDAGEGSDRLRPRQPLGTTFQSLQQHRRHLRIARQPLRAAGVDHGDPTLRNHTPAHLVSEQRIGVAHGRGANHVSRAQQLGAGDLFEAHVPRHGTIQDQQPRVRIGVRRRAVDQPRPGWRRSTRARNRPGPGRAARHSGADRARDPEPAGTRGGPPAGPACRTGTLPPRRVGRGGHG